MSHQRGNADKTLTDQQKETIELLVKALTSFMPEDHHERVDFSTYDDEEVSRLVTKSTEKRFRDDEDVARSSTPMRPVVLKLERLFTSACDDLIAESIRLEYSLRILGAGGPGMYGAWSLRRGLRIFAEILETCNVKDLRVSPNASAVSERHQLRWFIDGLPGPLYTLWKAFDELESFLLDFESFFHSVVLKSVLHSLKLSIAKQFRTLKDLQSKTYMSPAEGQELRESLVTFISESTRSFEICCKELSDFRTQGIPLIRTSQQNQTDRYLMLTTISTFFSAVTSATLQIAFQENPDVESPVLVTAINTFFFSSLVFSTASAVQALLAMAWHRSFIRLPEDSSAFQWVKNGPLVSLVISGAFFAIGLCLFIIASQKYGFPNSNHVPKLRTQSM